MQIDLVIPMVFPSDPVWQVEYQKYKGGAASVTRHVRYRSWNTEELLVRCCMKYMPWLGCIHILLASKSQVQPWMQEMQRCKNIKINIVFHRDFIPKEYLPCFSSPCIEMFLGRIPGLSEHFIYANDDMFPLSPLQETDFFRDGRPCQLFMQNSRPSRPDLFQRKCLYQQDMIDAPFGGHHKRIWLESRHTFAPVLKSSCEEVWRRHGEEIARYLSPLKRTDRSYNHYIYNLYQHLAGLDTPHAPREQYIGRDVATSRLGAILRAPDAGIVCLNDNEHIDDWEARAAAVRREIEKKLDDGAGEGVQTAATRLALVAIGRRENAYAVEFVDHYLALGFDHIFIIDNNHDGEEHFEDVLETYIRSGKVSVHDYRNREAVQAEAYNDIYRRYGAQYDWLAFFDFDEFLVMDHGTVREWLDAQREDAEVALVNWMCMTDGGMIYNDGRPMMERFTEPVPFDRCVQYDFPDDNHVKSIVRGSLGEVVFRNPHVPVTPHCRKPSPFRPYDFSRCYLKHFTTKTISEWLENKCSKGVGDRRKDTFEKTYRDRFFKYNEWTEAKQQYIDSFLGGTQQPLTVAVVHYNTPKLLRAAVLSLWKHTPGCRVVVFDNSDRLPIAGCKAWDHLRNSPLVTIIDNTRGQIIDFEQMLAQYPDREFSDRNKSNFGSAKHTASVDKLFDILPDGFVLMDSDVLFFRDISGLADRSVAAAGTLKPNDRVMRLLPLLCWLNVPMLREHGIRYFNGEKMWALSNKYPNNRYDTGAWLLEQVRDNGLPLREFSCKDYLLHLGHASWAGRSPMAWINSNAHLWT